MIFSALGLFALVLSENNKEAENNKLQYPSYGSKFESSFKSKPNKKKTSIWKWIIRIIVVITIITLLYRWWKKRGNKNGTVAK